MKNRFYIFVRTVACCLFFISIAGCNDNIPEIGDVNNVGVSSITLSEQLSVGVTLEKGTTFDISRKVSVLPVNATDRAESYYSIDVNVATVTAKGILSANSVGTSLITIAVGGKSVDFELTVIDKFIIPATNIQFSISTLNLSLDKEYNAAAMVTLMPLNANDGLDYSSSMPEVVSVDADGKLTGNMVGTATITVSSKSNPSIKDELEVTVVSFSGDYDRTNWTITASHTLFKTSSDEEKNSLSGAIDGDNSTNFCLVRPGKKYGSAPEVVVPSAEAIHFTIDMKTPYEVSYFRIRHRNTTQVFVRWHSFDTILGSNDGVNFTQIAKDVTITNVGTASEQESPNITIPSSTYRYIRFYAQSANCFFQSSYTSQGSSVQLQELYLGL